MFIDYLVDQNQKYYMNKLKQDIHIQAKCILQANLLENYLFRATACPSDQLIGWSSICLFSDWLVLLLVLSARPPIFNALNCPFVQDCFEKYRSNSKESSVWSVLLHKMLKGYARECIFNHLVISDHDFQLPFIYLSLTFSSFHCYIYREKIAYQQVTFWPF